MSNFTLKTSIALLLAPTAVMANTSTPHVELDPINITVSRSPQLLSKTPARVTVIGAKEIEQNPALNLSDVLQKDASVYIKQGGGIGQGTELYLRGGNVSHTLLLKDGARLNTQNAYSPLYTEQIDLTDVSQIEIVKGASSVQYGTDAINGVIQLRSLAPTKNSAFVTGIWGENRTYKAVVGGDLVHNGFYAQLRGQRLESDGARVLNTQDKQDKAGFDQKGYSTKFGYKQDSLHANVAFSENEGTNVYMDYATRKNTKQRQFKNQTLNTQIQYKPTDALTLNAQYSQFKDTQTWVNGTATPYTPKSKNTDKNITAKWDFTPQQNLLVGIAQQNSEYQTIVSGTDKKDMSSMGYFIQHQYNSDKFDTQVGVRVEDHDTFGNHTVGQGAVRYHISPNSSVFANIGSSFKAPYLGQLYSAWGDGNPDLNPEKGTSYEVGFDQYLTGNTKLSVSAYQNDIDHLISYDAIQGKLINIDKAQIKGAEIGVKWKHNDFFIGSEYAYNKTKNKSQTNTTLQGKELPYRPNNTLTLSAGIENTLYGANVSLVAHDKSYADRDNISQVAGYTTVDLAGYWNATPNVKLFTNFQNVGNVKHHVVKDGNDWYINDGRQANIGVTFSY